jgi:hypothetical protein
MAFIPVSRFRRAIIDDEDLERCQILRWRLNTHKTKRDGKTVVNEYVFADVFVNGKRKKLLLSRYVTNCPPGKRVWFNNHNNLDCRKKNLRIGGERLVAADVAFAQRNKLPDIFSMLEDSENGA